MLKSVVYFKAGEQGWSEVYNTNHNEVSEYVGVGAGSFQPGTLVSDFLLARRELLAFDCHINHIRVSKVGTPGNFDTDDYSEEEGHGLYNAVSVMAETPLCLIIQPQSGTIRRKRTYLGGIPHTIVKSPLEYVPNATFRDKFIAFSALLRSGIYVIPGRPARDPLTEQPITSFIVDPSGRTAVVIPKVRPVDSPLYWYVLIRGLKTPRGWNGIHRATGTGISVDMTIGPAEKPGVSTPLFINGQGATVVVAAFGGYVINDLDIVKAAKHDRGRPFGVPRGRR